MKNKYVTITAHNNEQIHQDSLFIIHTATSCHLIDEIVCKFTCKSLDLGMVIADQIRISYNEFIKKQEALCTP